MSYANGPFSILAGCPWGMSYPVLLSESIRFTIYITICAILSQLLFQTLDNDLSQALMLSDTSHSGHLSIKNDPLACMATNISICTFLLRIMDWILQGPKWDPWNLMNHGGKWIYLKDLLLFFFLINNLYFVPFLQVCWLFLDVFCLHLCVCGEDWQGTEWFGKSQLLHNKERSSGYCWFGNTL